MAGIIGSIISVVDVFTFLLMKTLVPQESWDNGYSNIKPHIASPKEPIRILLEKVLHYGPLESIELGCYPGRFLAVLGEMGHVLSGIDLTPGVDTILPEWLSGMGHKIGMFHRDDVFEFNPERKFDVVCSFGLIEHFVNWEELFMRHAALLAPGGTMIVTTPNFRSSIHHLLHFLLDRDNLKGHNLKSMDPRRWRELAEISGLDVIQCGGLGRFAFWTGGHRRNIIQRIVRRVILKTEPLWKFAPEGTLALAPYYAIVARRPASQI